MKRIHLGIPVLSLLVSSHQANGPGFSFSSSLEKNMKPPFLATVAFLLLFAMQCKNNGVNPSDNQIDTTSHNFSFQMFALGVDGPSSSLYDVTIVNDTLVYAVGEIFLKDSSGRIDPLRYNAAVWNGNFWKVVRIPYNYQGQAYYHPIQTVFAFNENEIWFAGSGVIEWNGEDYVPRDLPSSVWGANRINKVWGDKCSGVYIVGDAGSIARYSNGAWQKLSSGTTLPIHDIWGDGGVVLALASNSISFPQGKKLLRISGLFVSPVSDEGLPLSLEAVWFIATKGAWYLTFGQYYVVGDGVYKTNVLGNAWNRDSRQTSFYQYAIRGLGWNDIVTAGGFGGLAHYNGASWKNYAGSELPIVYGSYVAVAIHEKLVCAVGATSDKAIVAIGKR